MITNIQTILGRIGLTLLAGLLIITEAHAQTTFKCKNTAGKMEYSDRPCRGAGKEEQIVRGFANVTASQRAQAENIARKYRERVVALETTRRQVKPLSGGNDACDRLAMGYQGEKKGDVTRMIALCEASASDPSMQAAAGNNQACDRLAAGYRGEKPGDFEKMLVACNPRASIERDRADSARPCGHAGDWNCMKIAP